MPPSKRPPCRININAHLSNIPENILLLLGVPWHWDLHGLHGDAMSFVSPGPDFSISAFGDHLSHDVNPFFYHHAIWQQFVALSESPQREEESALLGGPEVLRPDTLTRPSEAAKGGQQLT